MFRFIWLTAFGILYGLVLGMPFLAFLMLLNGALAPDQIISGVCWWFGFLVLGGLTGRLALGRPQPNYAMFYFARHISRWL